MPSKGRARLMISFYRRKGLDFDTYWRGKTCPSGVRTTYIQELSTSNYLGLLLLQGSAMGFDNEICANPY